MLQIRSSDADNTSGSTPPLRFSVSWRRVEPPLQSDCSASSPVAVDPSFPGDNAIGRFPLWRPAPTLARFADPTPLPAGATCTSPAKAAFRLSGNARDRSSFKSVPSRWSVSLVSCFGYDGRILGQARDGRRPCVPGAGQYRGGRPPRAIAIGENCMDNLIRCQVCRMLLPSSWAWLICQQCGFRVCPHCLGRHSGEFSQGGYKCSQCPQGHLQTER
jgi:hypothetical protein